MGRDNITALVVTYNRKKLLKECINAILNQSLCPNRILIINNASTDGTEKLFETGAEFDRDFITCVNMKTNTGGAGGFYEGMRLLIKEDTDWAWIMDDDTIPNTDCLENLLKADEEVYSSGKKSSFYASTIFGVNGEFMNVPNVDNGATENGYPDFYEFLNKSILKIKDATFVSLLIRVDAIRKCGLPCKDYFIWGDDGEYTLRLTHTYGPAYMVGKSIAIHKRVGARNLSIDNFDEPGRIRLFHYYVRNNMINQLYYKTDKLAFITVGKKLFQGLLIFKLLPDKYGLLKIRSVWKGIFEGLFQYKKFKNYIDAQIQR